MTDSQTYATFLSHNSDDKDQVAWIAEQLEARHLRPFLDKWDLHSGDAFREKIEQALEKSTTAVVFFGRHGQGDWQRAEIDALIERALREHNEFRIAPALLEGAEESQVSSFLRRYGWIDFRRGLREPVVLEQLIAFVEGRPFRQENDDIDEAVQPYRGLERFDARHASNFFGRDKEIKELSASIAAQGAVAVVGPSGSGKSSLVRAGLSTALAAKSFDHGAPPLLITLRPGSDPLRSLADQVRVAADAGGVQREPADPLRWADQEVERMRSGNRALVQRLKSQFTGLESLVVLFVDQFEELFTQSLPAAGDPRADEAKADLTAFIASLKALADEGGERLRLLITVRADFVGRCLEEPPLRELMQEGMFLLGELSTDGLRAAIRLPAERSGAFFEQGLVERILKDVEGERGSLPLLEQALKELWRRREGRWLTNRAYSESGGVQQALRRLADRTFDELPSDWHRAIARGLFLRLSTLGEGVSDTRRRARREEMYSEDFDDRQVDETIAALLDKDARLILQDEDRNLEVTHEALIQQWPRLARWLDQNRDDLRLHRQLTEAARGWAQAADEKKDGHLLRQGRLEDAQVLAGKGEMWLSPTESAFLDASLALRRREELRAKRTLLALAGLSLAAVLAALGAGWFGFDARHQKNVAESERKVAEEQTHAAARALSESHYRRAVDAHDADELNLSLTYLAASLRADPSNPTPRDKLYQVLSERAFYLPEGPPIPLEDGIVEWALSPHGQVMLVRQEAEGHTYLETLAPGSAERVPGQARAAPVDLGAEVPTPRFSASGARMLLASGAEQVERWSWRDGGMFREAMLELPGGLDSSGLDAWDVADDGTVVAVGDGRIHIWAPGETVPEVAFEAELGDWRPDRLSLAEDGTYLVGWNDDIARLLDLRTRKAAGPELRAMPLADKLTDGGYLISSRPYSGPILIAAEVVFGAGQNAFGTVYGVDPQLGEPKEQPADASSPTVAEYENAIEGMQRFVATSGEILAVGLSTGRIDFFSTGDASLDNNDSRRNAKKALASQLPIVFDASFYQMRGTPRGELLATATMHSTMEALASIQRWRRMSPPKYPLGELRATGRLASLEFGETCPPREIEQADRRIELADAYLPDSLSIRSTGSEQALCAGRRWFRADAHDACISSLFLNRDGRLLLVGSWRNVYEGQAMVVDLTTDGCDLVGPRIDAGAVLVSAMSPDGATLALIYESDGQALGGDLQLWDTATGTALTRPIHPPTSDPDQYEAYFQSVEFDEDRNRVLIQGCCVSATETPSGDDVGSQEPGKERYEVSYQVGFPRSARSPDWLADLAELVGGQRLGTGGSLELVPERYQRLKSLRSKLAEEAAANPGDAFVRFAQDLLDGGEEP